MLTVNCEWSRCSLYVMLTPVSHWHRIAEWGYVLGGNGRITAIDENGRNFISDIRGPTNDTEPDIY